MFLKIKNLSYSYFKGKEIISNLDLEIQTGIFGLLGINGAGKSTLLNLISTSNIPSRGNIIFNNIDIVNNPNFLRQRLGFLPQKFGVYPNLTAYEFIKYIAAVKGVQSTDLKKRIYDLLDLVNLRSEANEQIHTFSGGMRQRVGIAQTLLNDPDIIIFDEPTVGLDPEERIRFRELLIELSATKIVIISSHIVSDIEVIANHIGILKSGKLITHGAQKELIDSIDGKIFQKQIRSNELSEFSSKYKVLNVINAGDFCELKYISEHENSVGNHVRVKPNLEDCFLFYNTR